MIYFVRHGLTDWNENITKSGEKIPKIQGRKDIPLNNNGKKQAESLYERLKDIKFSVVYCSPLLRTKQTMEIISKNKIPQKIDERIIERDFGEFEGLMPTEFDIDRFWNETVNEKYQKAESVKEVKTRVYDFIDELKNTYSNDENILVVSHGGISCFFVSYFKGNPPNDNYKSYIIKNGEILILDFKN